MFFEEGKAMQDFVNKQRGAVSIFLVLILVPTLVVASIMFDSSRLKLARSVVNSAGDLTLNTAMAQYDNVLKEMYGVFAISQSVDDLTANLKDYFRDSVSSLGLDTSTGDAIDSVVEGVLGDRTDLLKIETLDFNASNNEVYTLANPTLLRNQIVSFMKYRAPINTGLSLLDSLRGFAKLDDQMKVIEKKNAYYKEQEKVVEKCQDAWDDIKEYEEIGFTEKFFEEKSKEMDMYADAMKFVIRSIVMDHYVSTLNDLGTDKTFNKDLLSYFSGLETFYYRGKEVKAPKASNTYSYSVIHGAVQAFQDSVKKMEQFKRDTYYPKYGKINEYDKYYKIQNVIQNLKDNANGAKELNTYFYKAKRMYETYMKAKGELPNFDKEIERLEEEIEDVEDDIDDLESKDELSSSESRRLSRLRDKKRRLEDELRKVERLKKEENKAFDDAKKSYKEHSEEFNEATQTKTGATTDNAKNGMKETITGKMKLKYPVLTEVTKENTDKNTTAAKPVNEMKEGTLNCIDLVNAKQAKEICQVFPQSLKTFYDNVKEAMKILKKTKGCLDELRDSTSANGPLETKLQEWDRAVGSLDATEGDSISEQSREEIRSNREFLDPGQIEALSDHIDHLCDDVLANVKKEIEGYKYKGKMLIDQKDLSFEDIIKDVKAATDQDLKDLSSTKIEYLEGIVNSVYEKLYEEPYPGKDFTQKDQFAGKWDDPEDSPDLEKANKDCKKNDTPCDFNPFYRFLKNNFDKEVDSDVEEEKEEKREEAESGLKDQASSDKEEVKSSPSEHGSDIKSDSSPSNIWAGIASDFVAGTDVEEQSIDPDADDCTSGASEKLTSMFSGLLKELNRLAVTFRDDLFIANYAMNMFSYDTYENEKIYAAQTDRDSIDYATMKGLADAGPNDDVKKTMVSLTQVPIRKGMNQGYLGEVEYLIYGKQSLDSNIKSAYGTIFLIRFALNSIYAFTDSEINQTTTYVANLFAAVPFLIPIIKVALTLGIALAESSIDLLKLKAGMPVPLYKDKESWSLSYSNIVDGVVNGAVSTAINETKKAASAAVDKATEKLNEALDMTDQKLSDVADGVAEGFDDIQTSLCDKMNAQVDQYASTAIQQLQSYCQAARRLSSTEFVAEDDATGVVDPKLRELVYDAGFGQKEYNEVTFVQDMLKSWSESDISTATIAGEAKKIAVSCITEEFIILNLEQLDLCNKAVDEIQGAADILKEATDEMSKKMSKAIQSSCESFKTYKTEVINNLKAKMKEGAASFKSYVDDALDGIGDSASKSFSSSSVHIGKPPKNASGGNETGFKLAFQYSDYITVFLIIALIANQDGVVLRIGDTIQANMKLQNAGFEIRNAYTYVNLHAKVSVKPIMLSLPLFKSQTIDGKLNDSSWYEFDYNAVQGYS